MPSSNIWRSRRLSRLNKARELMCRSGAPVRHHSEPSEQGLQAMGQAKHQRAAGGVSARLAVLVMSLGIAVPAHAGSFSPPQGCQTWLTVQARGCRVSNHYRCEADPPGDNWRADFDQEGLFFLSRINSEAEWVESHEINPPVVQSLMPGAADPASFSELLAQGIDVFDFRLTRDNGQDSQVTGYDRLTGEDVTIDGVVLKRTAFEVTELDAGGEPLRQSRGFEYVHPAWRLFFSGPSEFASSDGWVDYDGSPMQFIEPGEPGFAATQPLFECGALMSRAPTAELQEARYE